MTGRLAYVPAKISRLTDNSQTAAGCRSPSLRVSIRAAAYATVSWCDSDAELFRFGSIALVGQRQIKMTIRFAVMGINHNHIFGQVNALLGAGASFTGFFAPEDDLAAAFAARYPQALRFDNSARILDDPTVALVASAAVNADRAALGIEVMRAGKDFMTDKPGVTSLAQLEEVRRTQAETRRIYSIYYSEHFAVRCVVKAGELVQAGAIGKVVNTVGLGPHRMDPASRPRWFFERERYGGILTDIGSHQIEQFLFFTGAEDVKVAAATVANRANPAHPELQDFGDILLRTSDVTGYVRVDWLTPGGLPAWGDGRLVIAGTEGTIEMRKYVDIDGETGTDHLFLIDNNSVQRIDCSFVELPYGRQLVQDVLHRTEAAMPQARCFKAMELALTAQAMAEGRA
jgi:predicted dehydrogenase